MIVQKYFLFHTKKQNFFKRIKWLGIVCYLTCKSKLTVTELKVKFVKVYYVTVLRKTHVGI